MPASASSKFLSQILAVLSETFVIALTVTSAEPSVSLPGNSSMLAVTSSEVPIIPADCPTTSQSSSEKRKSRILTDTPKKDELQKALLKRQAWLDTSQEKISAQKKGKNSKVGFSESQIRSIGSKLKAAKRKKTKTV